MAGENSYNCSHHQGYLFDENTFSADQCCTSCFKSEGTKKKLNAPRNMVKFRSKPKNAIKRLNSRM